MDRRLSVVSLFSGAGGLDVGLDRDREFDLRACVELDEVFCATLSRNRDAGLLGSAETKVIRADLSKLSPESLMAELGIAPGELDLLVGGPPCQSFSTAGRRGTVNDPRGLLLWDFLRFVEAFQPRFFVMENVRGLLSAALNHRAIANRPDRGGPPLRSDELPGSVINRWVDDLCQIPGGEYRLDVFEVNAVNYGAPQLRERVLLFGNRENKVVDFPRPTHGPATGKPFATLRDALKNIDDPSPVLMDFSPRKKHYLRQVPAGGNWRMLPERVAIESMGRAFYAKGGRSGWWRKLSWDLPCPTITTMPNHASTSMCHPDEVRVLSVAECARIQEFPEGWTFVGSPAQQMKQVGNAVPSRLGTIAARALLVAMRTSAKESTPRVRREYLQSHVRTRQWWKNGKAYQWDGADGNATYGALANTSDLLGLEVS